MKKTLSLLALVITLIACTVYTVKAKADDNILEDASQELSPSHPDITTANCHAHGFFVTNTMVILEVEGSQCDSFRGAGSDMGASETRLTKNGFKVSIEGRSRGQVKATLMNIDGYPFRKDEIRVIFP